MVAEGPRKREARPEPLRLCLYCGKEFTGLLDHVREEHDSMYKPKQDKKGR